VINVTFFGSSGQGSNRPAGSAVLQRQEVREASEGYPGPERSDFFSRRGELIRANGAERGCSNS